jgi:hypothetical protein
MVSNCLSNKYSCLPFPKIVLQKKADKKSVTRFKVAFIISGNFYTSLIPVT